MCATSNGEILIKKAPTTNHSISSKWWCLLCEHVVNIIQKDAFSCQQHFWHFGYEKLVLINVSPCEDHSWRVYSFIELNRSFRCSCSSRTQPQFMMRWDFLLLLLLLSACSSSLITFLMCVFRTFFVWFAFLWFFISLFGVVSKQRVVDGQIIEWWITWVSVSVFFRLLQHDHYLCESTAMLIMNWNVNESNLHLLAVVFVAPR